MTETAWRRITSLHGKEKIWINRRAGCLQKRSIQERLCLTIRKQPFFFFDYVLPLENGRFFFSNYVLPIENGRFFFEPAEIQSRTKFLNGVVICGLSERSGSEEAERSHRSEATKLSGAQERSDKVDRSHRSEVTKLGGARMPEQHRAGQPVHV